MKIGLIEVKKALKDERFIKSLPEELNAEIEKFKSNPGCPCNMPLYRTLLKDYTKELIAYYPSGEVEQQEYSDLMQNKWSVINCKASELEDKLQKLSHGRKQLAITRYEDEVTVVINDLDF